MHGRAGYILCVSFILASCSGCAHLALLLSPDLREKVNAEYKLPGGKIVLIVDDYMVETANETIKDRIATSAIELMMANKASRRAEFIPYSKVQSVSMTGSDGTRYSLQNLGKKIGGETVIYINIVQFDLNPDEDIPLIEPVGRAQVKVVDVESGDRLWPIDIAGRTVQVHGKRDTEDVESADRQKWNRKLADMIAQVVAELFYDHRAE